MKIAAVTDIHGYYQGLAKLADRLAGADLLLVAGDITNFGGRERAVEAIACLEALPVPVRLVPGNCDRAAAAAAFAAAGLSLDSRWEMIGGVVVAGLGGSLPCPAPTCCEFDDTALGERLEAATRGCRHHDPLFLLVHQPPFGTSADWAHNGRHVGSRTIRRFIERYEPRAVFCGHIHEGRGSEQLGRTHLLNPGPLRAGHYAWVEIVDGQVTTAEIR